MGTFSNTKQRHRYLRLFGNRARLAPGSCRRTVASQTKDMSPALCRGVLLLGFTAEAFVLMPPQATSSGEMKRLLQRRQLEEEDRAMAAAEQKRAQEAAEEKRQAAAAAKKAAFA